MIYTGIMVVPSPLAAAALEIPIPVGSDPTVGKPSVTSKMKFFSPGGNVL